MGTLLQPKLGVGLGGPSRQIAKRTNRIDRVIWISPVDELMKGYVSSTIITSHGGTPGNSGY
jgi:hypothetical protein